MIIPRLSNLMTSGKALFLAYDQGLEHGPGDFNLKNVDPKYILDIALEGKYDGIILEHGVAEKYYHGAYKDIPLIIKLNSKSSLTHISPIAKQICSVKRAIQLGAKAVGFVIYDGSKQEPEMFETFGRIVEEAHDLGIPVIAWMYPRGKAIHNELSTEILAYSARIGLELGADIVKIKYNDDPKGFKWVVRNAGLTKVVVAGGQKRPDPKFLKMTQDVMGAGASGIAVGRNVWQSENPFALSKALHAIIHDGKTADEVMHYLEGKN
jgi:class I fructose-bisphosphate aldolase